MRQLSRVLSMLCMLAVAVSALAQSENFIRNGKFLEIKEGSRIPDNWYPQGGVDKWHPDNNVETEIKPKDYDGNSYRITGNHLLLQRTLPITPGKAYRFSFKMKTVGMPWKAQARFQIIWLGSDGRELLKEYRPKPDAPVQKMWDHQWVWTSGDTDWKEYSIPSFTAPANAASGLIRIGKLEGEEGFAYFADLRMEECPMADEFENRIATIPFGSDPAKGVLIDDFIMPSTGVCANHQTEIFAVFDEEAIRVRAVCHQKSIGGEQFIGNIKNNNSDAVEMLFLPPGEKEQYHILVFPSGNRLGLVEEWSDVKWPFDRHNWDLSQVKTSVEVKENEWIADFEIPFSAMGRKAAPVDGEEWRASFCREVMTSGQELSAWATMPAPAFQRTASFGKVFFSRTALSASAIRVTPKSVSCQIRNPGNAPRKISVNRVSHSDKGAFLQSSATYEVAPNTVTEISSENASVQGDVLWVELREGEKMVAKHCALPSSLFIALEFLDPEKVRTQTVYLATDTPFFIAWHMSHNIPSKISNGVINRNVKPVDFVLEVPEGVDFRGMMHDASAYRWEQSKVVKPIVTEVENDGKKLKQFRFELPLIANWNEPQFLFFYDCKMENGLEFEGRSWFIVDGNVESIVKRKFKTMSVGKVRKTFRHLPFNIGLMDAVTLYGWFPHNTLQQFRALGFNSISVPIRRMQSKEFYKGDDPQTVEDFYDLLYQEFLAQKEPFFMNTVSISTGPEEHAWTRRDEPETVGIRRDGSKCTKGGYADAPAICFNYRGELYQKWIDKLVNSSAFAKYHLTWLALDMEIWRNPAWDEICFCPKCLRLFKEFCLKNNRPDMAEIDPRTATGDDFTAMWKKFQAVSAAAFTTTAVDAVREKVKGSRSTSPWGEFTSQDYSIPGAQYSDDSLNFFEMSVYHTPDGNYRKLLDVITRKDSGVTSKNLSTGLSYGQTAGCPDWHMQAKHCKESIFEVMIFGTRSVVYYYDLYIDPLRMKYMVDALNAVTPFENIILDGALDDNVSASTKDLILTRRSLNGESLMAVRSYYAEKPVDGTVTLGKVSKAMNVYDCETGELVGRVSPEKPSFSYAMPEKCCRMLYVGTEAQWKARRD